MTFVATDMNDIKYQGPADLHCHGAPCCSEHASWQGDRGRSSEGRDGKFSVIFGIEVLSCTRPLGFFLIGSLTSANHGEAVHSKVLALVEFSRWHSSS